MEHDCQVCEGEYPVDVRWCPTCGLRLCRDCRDTAEHDEADMLTREFTTEGSKT